MSAKIDNINDMLAFRHLVVSEEDKRLANDTVDYEFGSNYIFSTLRMYQRILFQKSKIIKIVCVVLMRSKKICKSLPNKYRVPDQVQSQGQRFSWPCFCKG